MLAVFWPAMFGSGYLFRRRVLCAVPVIGSAHRFASLSTFCCLLAELIQHRVPLPAAVRAAGNGARDVVLETCCEELAGKIEQGRKLDQAALTIREFPSQLVYLFRSADHPEAFAESLRATAEMYEVQARLRAGMVPLIAEPVVITAIALALVLVVAGMFWPFIELITFLS